MPLNNDSGTEIMLAQRLQAKPEPHEDPLLCGRLLKQEAAIFSQSPSTPPGCDVGYGELNNDYSGTEIMLAQRLPAKLEPHEDPLYYAVVNRRPPFSHNLPRHRRVAT